VFVLNHFAFESQLAVDAASRLLRCCDTLVSRCANVWSAGTRRVPWPAACTPASIARQSMVAHRNAQPLVSEPCFPTLARGASRAYRNTECNTLETDHGQSIRTIGRRNRKGADTTDQNYRLSISEVLKRGVLAYQAKALQQSASKPYDIYRKLDLGSGGNA
jgi:hypothetical protein